MVEFLSLSERDRRFIIQQVSVKTGMSVKAIEKDWWVTLALKAENSHCLLKNPVINPPNPASEFHHRLQKWSVRLPIPKWERQNTTWHQRYPQQYLIA